MNTPTRIAAFALGLAAVFGGAVGVGATVGPVGPSDPPAPAHDAGGQTGAGHGDGDGGHATRIGPAEAPGGLQVTQDGYTLALADAVAPAGAATPVAFEVLGPDGSPVTAYATDHDVDLHLVAVRRDLSGYQHVHPELGPDGVWRADLALEPGSWRLFADFAPGADGANRILGADLAVAGSYEPRPLPAPAAVAEVDGYTVVLSGELTPGEESDLTLSVSRDGAPVTDLQPYLGAYGHLVALRDGDLAYLHVHPAEADDGTSAAPGPHVRFTTTAPSAGTYRLFLDFKHGDVVRTAEFTVHTDASEEHGP
ncbi:hypothetical protein GCU60_07625 [Blastococcus saxobsidens]|uniref:Secreted protein n=1 Tax=Blastococcus saxobsidens TaxID=138336 RepID=A0A6L9W2C2_9ACTN|nr:hypothetical protein [Blastococcus saxobsidens]NEK85630.1 hypothetical protein [Blastococcus saxobsidens]